MIFTGFKRKSNQLFFNKRLPELLKNSDKDAIGKVKNAIVFLDDISNKNVILKSLNELLPDLKTDIELVVFQQKVSKESTTDGVFEQGDFGWYGKIRSEKLKHILTKKYDLLINYSKVDILYCNLLILQCKIGFRVGFGHLDGRFYDLIIDCKPSEIKAFNKELKKYLQILKKI